MKVLRHNEKMRMPDLPPLAIETSGPREQVRIGTAEAETIIEARHQAYDPPAQAEGPLAGELRNTREQLQLVRREHRVALEMLRNANDTLHSMLDEFHSTTEELETSKEEIHAMNEELLAVNTQLAAKVEQLDTNNTDLLNLFNSVQVATVFLDTRLVIRSFTPAVASIYNLLPGDVGRVITDITSRLNYVSLRDDVRQVLATLEPLERRLMRDDGVTHYLLRILPYRTPNGTVDGTLVTLVDVTMIVQAEQHQRQAEAQLAHLSAYDPLTGLSNRRTLEAHMEEWRLDARKHPAALLFLDLDRFKTINDSFGHVAGDAILVQVAARLRSMVPAGSVVSRLGGDEFILFWPGAEQQEAEALAGVLVRELARPFLLEGQPHHATASIGVACSTITGADDLMRSADSAMYAAKRQGGSRTMTFEPTFRAVVLSHMQIEQDLFRALENDELEIHYQPLVTVPARSVYGFEALIRWCHPERGWVSPAEFIPRAEEAGLITRIGFWVMDSAIRQIREWRRIDSGLIISFNVSAYQLSGDRLSSFLADLLLREEVPPGAVCIEITESALLDQAAIGELQRLRALGVSIAVDDFGTGYSSLSYLQKLPVDTVKIDRSFVALLGTNPKMDRFFGMIVDLAHLLDLHTIAEGCETEEQWRLINDMGCEAAQGWLVARAMSAATASHFLMQSRSGAGPSPIDPAPIVPVDDGQAQNA